MCGVTFSVTPISWRSMVVKGLLAPAASVVYEPVWNGTFWPTRISASWLSRVSRLGVESRLLLLLDDSAVISAPKLRVPTPMMAPSGRLLGISFSLIALSTLPTEMPVLPKLTPPAPPVLPRASMAHCTPRASVMSPDTSTIAASTMTWARGMSSCRTMLSMVPISSGSASSTSAFRLSSARMRMFCGRLVVASPPSGLFRPSDMSPRVSARDLASLWRSRMTRVLAERVVGVSRVCASAASLLRASLGPMKIRRLVRESAMICTPAVDFASPRTSELRRTSAMSTAQPCCRFSTP